MNLLLVDDEVAMVQIMKKQWIGKSRASRNYIQRIMRMKPKISWRAQKLIFWSVITRNARGKRTGTDQMDGGYLSGGILSIILTGYPDFNYARSAVSLGVYQYLLKPVAFEELEEVVHHAVERVEEIISSRNRKDMTGIEEMSDPVRVIKAIPGNPL